jgi:hypothetical protein
MLATGAISLMKLIELLVERRVHRVRQPESVPTAMTAQGHQGRFRSRPTDDLLPQLAK